MCPYLRLQKAMRDFDLAIILRNDSLIKKANDALTEPVRSVCNPFHI